jgi:hypothetical protein
MSVNNTEEMDNAPDTEWMDADSEDTDAGTDGDESPDPDFVAENEGLKFLNGELCLDGNPEYAKEPTKFPEIPAEIADSLRPTFKMAPDQKAVVVNGKIHNKKASKAELAKYLGKTDWTKASDPSNDDYRLGVPLDVIKFLRPSKKPKASAALTVPSSLPPLPSPCKPRRARPRSAPASHLSSLKPQSPPASHRSSWKPQSPNEPTRQSLTALKRLRRMLRTTALRSSGV